MCEKYAGFKNYETWAVNNWINSNYLDYETMKQESIRIYKESKDDERFTKIANARFQLMDWIKSWIEDEAAERKLFDQGLFSDLLQFALGRINYYEIATGFIDEIKDKE